ncbi:hypothetical protein FOZ76_14545 [Verticiella sediminum]|uniref:Uncharacterized protein n=1 Tax=Verticiella sediminum TaxID=1247510 RepID=A0A556AIE5_9BURK|nr:hypothetical protein [Verticiella sediminum]TSH92636.1 hypothetical protein FOZ76_14545 [Verticiella sediminum]
MSNILQLFTDDGPGAKTRDTEPMAVTFQAWWAAYPRKCAKKAAERAWSRMPEAHRRAACDALPVHVEHWRARYGEERSFIPHPATWLNGERWDDELDPIVKPAAAEPRSAPGLAWWMDDGLMEAKGRDVGAGPARPGETRDQYRGRIAQLIARGNGRAA